MMNRMKSAQETKTVGILAGVGPLAGAFFYKRLIELTPAESDQQHLKVILISDPGILSRVDHLLERGLSPAPALQHVARQLQALGADFIAIPSATTHAYWKEISKVVRIPVINLLAEVGQTLHRSGHKHIIFLATQATAQKRLFDPYLAPDAIPIYPEEPVQKQVQYLIDAVKSGASPGDLHARLSAVTEQCWAAKADCVVLACTELPIIFPDRAENETVISITDVLAKAVIANATAKESR
ncbi:MAG TPA: amino acid racemase [Ktedonobacteraceae bacterium]|nr:amino acid racemase [Ktedonobacteraceae bacterium]